MGPPPTYAAQLQLASLCKRLRSPRIDSKESAASLCSPCGPVRQPYSYSVPSPPYIVPKFPHSLLRKTNEQCVLYKKNLFISQLEHSCHKRVGSRGLLIDTLKKRLQPVGPNRGRVFSLMWSSLPKAQQRVVTSRYSLCTNTFLQISSAISTFVQGEVAAVQYILYCHMGCSEFLIAHSTSKKTPPF